MGAALLPIVLVIRIALFPLMPPIYVERFETEAQCKDFSKALDKSTKVVLRMDCEVDT